jgi:hypothetical protein
VDAEGILLPREFSIDTDDRTPLAKRWGGWYVTGQASHEHRGNALLKFDTTPYLTERSDVVALLVLEHQLYIKNLITRLNFKTRSLSTSPRTTRSLRATMRTAWSCRNTTSSARGSRLSRHARRTSCAG